MADFVALDNCTIRVVSVYLLVLTHAVKLLLFHSFFSSFKLNIISILLCNVEFLNVEIE